VAARDLDTLLKEIHKAKRRFDLPAAAAVVSCYEAGRDAFWLHRWLTNQGIANVIVDSASIPTVLSAGEQEWSMRGAPPRRQPVSSSIDLRAGHHALTIVGPRLLVSRGFAPTWTRIGAPTQ
jgi:hypothetical protein